MKVVFPRPKNLGYLFVVGGPGGSGASTIAKMLARKYELRYVYGGGLMRRLAKKYCYESLDDFLDMIDRDDQYRYDKEIDGRLIRVSYQPNVLIDSKVFAALATKYQIPCTVSIWLNSDIEVRTKRSIEKKGINVVEEGEEYERIKNDLMARYANDMERYMILYGVDYDKPKLYNDIVVDSSRLSAMQTFNIIVKAIEDGKYLK